MIHIEPSFKLKFVTDITSAVKSVFQELVAESRKSIFRRRHARLWKVETFKVAKAIRQSIDDPLWLGAPPGSEMNLQPTLLGDRGLLQLLSLWV